MQELGLHDGREQDGRAAASRRGERGSGGPQRALGACPTEVSPWRAEGLASANHLRGPRPRPHPHRRHRPQRQANAGDSVRSCCAASMLASRRLAISLVRNRLFRPRAIATMSTAPPASDSTGASSGGPVEGAIRTKVRRWTNP